VVDASDHDPEGQIAAVREVLEEIGATGVDEILVVNKTDIAEPHAVTRLLARHEGAVAVSAVTGEGIDDLLEAVADRLQGITTEISVTIPYVRGDVVSSLHDLGEVISESHDGEGTHMRVRLPKADADRFAVFAR